MTNLKSQLFHYVIRLNKEDSAFFYFQLEANDGICFYSTLPFTPHVQYRDIDLKGDLKFKSEMVHLLENCSLKFKIDIITDEIISDN
jgi:hypothetical protein